MSEFEKEKDLLMTAGEVCQYLKLSLSTLYRFTKSGRIKGLKLGRQWRYRKEDVDRFYVTSPTRPTQFRKHETSPDQRQHSRINCRLACVWTSSLGKDTGEAEIKNVGAGGLFLKAVSSPSIQVNDPLELEFSLDDNSAEPLKLAGKVIHVANGGVGVKFRRLSAKAEEVLTRYVD